MFGVDLLLFAIPVTFAVFPVLLPAQATGLGAFRLCRAVHSVCIKVAERLTRNAPQFAFARPVEEEVGERLNCATVGTEAVHVTVIIEDGYHSGWMQAGCV